jgi:N4-(beta-N-acetylglucosaminyl)-L-asparaginase
MARDDERERKHIERRQFLGGALAGGAIATGILAPGEIAGRKAHAAEQRQRTASAPNQIVVISSDNGLEATKRAYERIVAGADTLDAAIEGVGIVEDDPEDTSVGYGGLPNEDGIVELDASVMHGPTHQAGAVAALRNVRHPAQVAKLVMQQTDHVLLVGEGALRFARAQGFPEENLLTEKARKIWLYWKQKHSDNDDWLPPPDAEVDAEAADYFKRHTGTIHCAARNAKGEISCVTSTSGLAFKLPGRVGDSPIVGAGLYVDNEIGSCGSTGRGEANLQNLSSFAAVELMRTGLSPEEAGLEVMRRVAKHTVPRLLNAKGQPKFDLKLYVMAKDGRHACVCMRGDEKYAVTDATGTRHERARPLFE